MARGRPKGDEPTCVLAVRVPIALREQLDRYLDALETRVGLKASRNEIIRHALRQLLEAERHEGRALPPPHVPALCDHRDPGRATLQGQEVTIRAGSAGSLRPGRSLPGSGPIGACTVASACATLIGSRESASPTTAREARLAPRRVFPLCTNRQSYRP